MKLVTTHRRVRFATLAVMALLLAGLFAPVSLAAQTWGGVTPPAAAGQQARPGGNVPSAPNSYPLMGDTGNSGSSSTAFLGVDNSSTGGAWQFLNTSTAAGSVGLLAYDINSASGIGVKGLSTGNGVQGVQGNSNVLPPANSAGVYGYSTVSNGVGVLGLANNGASAYGVWGVSTTGYGGVFYGPSAGVYSTGSIGVFGSGSGATSQGVYGSNTTNSTNAQGVYGHSTYGPGLNGGSTNYIGLNGHSDTNTGIYADTGGSASGLVSRSVGGYGADIRSTNYSGIYAQGGSGQYAGYFNGPIYHLSSFSEGTDASIVPTTQGDKVMYTGGATQAMFSDEGTATLVNGKAEVGIDALYAQTVNLAAGYHVFVTPHSADTAGLAVVSQTATGFEVRELQKGNGNFSFDWRIDGLRKGTESDRMAAAPVKPEVPSAPVPPPTNPPPQPVLKAQK